MAYGILVIEDETSLARNIRTYLARAGYEVWTAEQAGTGLEAFETFKPDVVLLDQRLPDADGIEILPQMLARDRSVKVVLMTAHGSVSTAVSAMKAGAYDYLSKPVVLSELLRLIERALGEERIGETLSYYQRQQARQSGLDAIVGHSAAIVTLKEKLRVLLAAEARLGDASAAAVLITGETGTGKELIARAIHFDGPRRAAPFIEINCAALPASLIEGELFGYERGAFTDAKGKKLGLVEAAEGGTLFLDEVAELELPLQAKLLKLLEDRTVRRLGGLREIPVNVRVLAATNRPLEELVRAGIFRSDLFYRLKTIDFEVPPLRARGHDILTLARHFIELHAGRYRRPPPSLGPEAEAILLRHGWPGNVRELRNVTEQIVLFCPDAVVGADALPLSTLRATDAASEFRLPSAGVDIEQVERSLVEQALERTAWNITAAARLLGLSRDTLRYRIEKFSLKRP